MQEDIPQFAIALTPVEGSNIIGYALEGGDLFVQFAGSGEKPANTYRYVGMDDASRALFGEFVLAEGKGKFFARSIRPTFAGQRVAIVNPS